MILTIIKKINNSNNNKIKYKQQQIYKISFKNFKVLFEAIIQPKKEQQEEI